MDIADSVTYAQDVYAYIYAQARSMVAVKAMPVFVADTQVRSHDLPDEYVFMAQQLDAPERYAMCYGSYEGSGSLVVEAVCNQSNFAKTQAMMFALGAKFLQGFDKYSIIIGKASTVTTPTVAGHRFVYTVNYTFLYKE